WPDDEFHSFLDRSSCALTNLEFNDCSISQEQIILFLGHKACNTLESFALKQCNTAGDALLEQLTYYGPEHPPCYPNLRAIELRDIYATDGLLSDLVESR
ncbi:hypothetical protein B0H14DRAFT_2188921, partial [Mycena olivaceomarginata]